MLFIMAETRSQLWAELAYWADPSSPPSLPSLCQADDGILMEFMTT